jgi:hypothetical protein
LVTVEGTPRSHARNSSTDSDHSSPEWAGGTNLIVGLLNLSSWLLISLAETQGEATDVELQERATNILRKLSQRLTQERFDLHATTEGGSGAE